MFEPTSKYFLYLSLCFCAGWMHQMSSPAGIISWILRSGPLQQKAHCCHLELWEEKKQYWFVALIKVFDLHLSMYLWLINDKWDACPGTVVGHLWTIVKPDHLSKEVKNLFRWNFLSTLSGGLAVQATRQVRLIMLEDSTNISGPPTRRVTGSENQFEGFLS